MRTQDDRKQLTGLDRLDRCRPPEAVYLVTRHKLSAIQLIAHEHLICITVERDIRSAGNMYNVSLPSLLCLTPWPSRLSSFA
jgi:hypothetical protein